MSFNTFRSDLFSKDKGALASCLITQDILQDRFQSDLGGWMHETSAQGWCTGKTLRDRMEREVGGGIGMGNTYKSMADSCQCMAKTTTIL